MRRWLYGSLFVLIATGVLSVALLSIGNDQDEECFLYCHDWQVVPFFLLVGSIWVFLGAVLVAAAYELVRLFRRLRSPA